VSREGDLLDLGVAKGVLEKSGTWLSYKGERIGQGRENARLFLRDNADFRERIEHDVRKALGLPTMNHEDTGKSGEAKAAGESTKTVSMAAAAAVAKARTGR
jgi:recombination protein RecA